jgi:D-arabinitol dehydrogenase (NADP+)
VIGAGPTGLVLAQLLKYNGGCHITLAANAGIKMELAQKLDVADEYIFLDRKSPEK